MSNYENAFNYINTNGSLKPIISCYGPTGPTGPTGPIGLTSLDSILIAKDLSQIVNSSSLLDLGLIINQTGTSISFNSPYNVILLSGTYYLVYSVLVNNSTSSGDVGISLLVDNIVIPTASQYISATKNQTQMVLQHNLTVTNNSTISLENLSPVANNYHDSSLSIIKIG